MLRLLGGGSSIEDVVGRFSKRLDEDPRLVRELVHESLVHAAKVVREQSLLTPASAAFIEGLGAVRALAALTQDVPRLSPAEAARAADAHDRIGADPQQDLSDLRALSARVLDAYLTTATGSTECPRPRQVERDSIAMQYAEALVRQEEVVDSLTALSTAEAPLQAALPTADRKRLDEFLLYRGLRRPLETLDTLLTGWRCLVERLDEGGKSLSYEEYEDWLFRRDSLEDALSLLSPTAQVPLEAQVHVLNRRFSLATLALATSIRPASRWRLQPWWWYRVPDPPGDGFYKRLKSLSPTAAREVDAARIDSAEPNKPRT